MSDQDQDVEATRLHTPQPVAPDSWPETSGPSALTAIEASTGPVPRVSLRPDVDPNASTVKVEPSRQERTSPPGPGRFEILGEIARGGMGAVLRGRDSDLNRDLAIKVLLEKYAENVEVLGRFIEEAQIGGQLQHPGIVPVYELGQFPDKRPFFAMKLVKGRTLAALLKERHFSEPGR
ncbi:MAG: pknB 22, partial [Planctomycetota bacterium]|nr:pknB 22 [Planctomycetota bacterium]